MVRLPGRPRKYSALLDTGADSHFIDIGHAEAAELRSCKVDNDVRGLNGKQGPKPVYESKLVLRDAGDLEIDGPLTGCNYLPVEF